jgi:uncharacterized protein (DUF1499 family)
MYIQSQEVAKSRLNTCETTSWRWMFVGNETNLGFFITCHVSCVLEAVERIEIMMYITHHIQNIIRKQRIKTSQNIIDPSTESNDHHLYIFQFHKSNKQMASCTTLFRAAASFSLALGAAGLVEPKPNNNNVGTLSRRNILSTLGGISASSLFNTDSVARAFDNRISTKYDDRPKQRGGKPSDIGVLTRKDIAGEDYKGLKHCKPNGAPNCVCSTESVEDDPEHSIPAWVWPESLGNDKKTAFQQLAEVVNAYEPGQSSIDGGGFKIITNDPENCYIYAQFESLKNGYVDDFELAFIDGLGDRAVQVRSSSRIGYLDFGVNAKRLNFLADKLRAKGWDAKGVDYDTHQNYAIQNELI